MKKKISYEILKSEKMRKIKTRYLVVRVLNNPVVSDAVVTFIKGYDYQ